MKIELVKDNTGAVGYNLIPENSAEQIALNEIRDRYFFGVNQEVIKYDGINVNTDETMVTKMHFLKDKYRDCSKEEKAAMLITVEVKETQSWYYQCPKCGSTNVQMKGWTRPNNYGEFVDLCSDKIYEGDCWCDDCKEHVVLEYVELKVGEQIP